MRSSISIFSPNDFAILLMLSMGRVTVRSMLELNIFSGKNYKIANLRMLITVANMVSKTEMARVVTETKSPLKKDSWPSCTRRRIGTTIKSDIWVAARTVRTRSDTINAKDVVSSTAESAPRMEARAETVEISGCVTQ